MKKILFIATFFLTASLFGQDFKVGKKIFKANCASCHKMDKKVVGPALQNVVDEQGKDWVLKWVKNNQELRESGDAHANEIYQEYNGMAMPSYDHLDDKTLNNVVEYLAQWKDKQEDTKPANTNKSSNSTQTIVQSNSIIPKYIKILIIVFFVILLAILAFLSNLIKKLANAYARSKSMETYLLKRQDLTTDEVNQEFDKFIEQEVKRRIKERISNLKKKLKNTLKDY
jgi:mono/diheme cytochrome c family protein